MRIRDTLGLFQWLHRQYGGIVGYNVLHLKFCAIFDPELIHEVLVQQRTSFEKGFLYRRASVIGRLTTGEGAEHRKFRTAVQPFFHRKMLDSYVNIMVAQTIEIRDTWCDGQIVEAQQAMYNVFYSIADTVFFGNRLPLNLKMATDVDDLMALDFQLALLPARAMLKQVLPRYRRLRNVKDQIDKLIYTEIHDARADMGKRTDLVAFLIRAADAQGSPAFDDLDVLEIVLEMMIGSHTTSGTALAWLFYYLSQNPSVRTRLEQEVDTVLGNRRAILEDYERLRYTRAVVDEALRLGTPAYFIGRTAKEACRIGGYLLPAGTHVQLCGYMSHRDTRYFPNPNQFCPARWLQPQSERPKYAYMPFGAGHRSCVGEEFARMGMAYAVASITQRWRFEMVSDRPPAVNTLVAYIPKHGIPMTMVERHRSA
ncbi:MAG: cytochrome P450 [Caldilineaceae bacterium]|nr:cytochrome P450 [Caldilineaceae bacterium]